MQVLIGTQEPEGTFGPRDGPRIRELERAYGNVEVYASKSGKLSSFLIDKWFNTTLQEALFRAIGSMSVDDEEDNA